MVTIGRWYLSRDSGQYADEEAEKFSKGHSKAADNIVLRSLALRRSKFGLSEHGEEIWENKIKPFLIKKGAINPKKSYDPHCGCSCGCSPGIKIVADYAKEGSEVDARMQYVKRSHKSVAFEMWDYKGRVEIKAYNLNLSPWQLSRSALDNVANI